MKSYEYHALGFVLQSTRALPLPPWQNERAQPCAWIALTQGAHHLDDARAGSAGSVCLHAVEEAPGGLLSLRAWWDGATLTLRYGAWSWRASPLPAAERAAGATEEAWRVEWSRGAGAAPEDGPVDDEHGHVLATLVERVLAPLLLLLRDEGAAVVLLHGNAVLLDARAVVFVGPSGVGKSTASALFLEEGARLLADDRVPCWLRGHHGALGEALVGAGPSSLRVSSDSLVFEPANAAVSEDFAGAVSLSGVTRCAREPDGKQALRFEAARVARALAPLGALLLLERVADPRAEGSSAADFDASGLSLARVGAAALGAVLLQQHFSVSAPPAALRAAQFRAVLALARAWAPRTLRVRYVPQRSHAAQRAQLGALARLVREFVRRASEA